jgi:tetratricopeptide (TPR) repeat protein
MKPKATSRAKVLDVLQQAAALHAGQRATMFLLRSLIWVVVAIPVLLLSDVLFHFSEIPRLVGILGLALAFIICAGISIGIAAFVRPPLLRIARLLESRNPALGSRLVNILQLDADSRSESVAPLTRDLARQAVEEAGLDLDLRSLPPLAREPGLPRQGIRAFVCLASLGLVTFFGGQHVRQQWLRFLDPYGDHPPFSLTRLEILQPAVGETVLYGDSRTVEVRASGHLPKELLLVARSTDGVSTDLTLPMSARGDGTFVARLENIRQPLELTARAADSSTRSLHRLLNLVLTPQIGPAIVRLEPPAYTQLPAREIPYRFSALQALEGTRITFRIQSNRPLGAGSIRLESEDAPLETIPLAPASEGPTETAVANLTVTRSGRLGFSLVDVVGNSAIQQPTATLTMTRDLPPAIAITSPEKDAMVVEGLTIPITVDAGDDYGLSAVRLHIGINDKFQPVASGAPEGADKRRHQLRHSLDLAKLGAHAGDQITLFAEAIDTRPDPQLTRTAIRRLGVITEQDYNDRIREEADVAMIAGKYERLLQEFEKQIAEQRRIEEKLKELSEAARKEGDKGNLLGEFSMALSDQLDLNRKLDQLANEMSDFGRDNPVYDFEKDLEEKLRQQAEEIRKSVAQADADTKKAVEQGPPPPQPPGPKTVEDLATAAREQRERLQGGSDQMNEEIRKPLEELADLHELMKDFKRFEQLAEKQGEIAEQSKAYQDKADPNAEDRLAMRELGARQREIARELEQLSKKLKQDADAAQEKFPEAADSARQLADDMKQSGLPELARQAAQSLLDSKPDGHAQADKLQQEMDKLLADAAQPGQEGVAKGMDRALKLQRNMKPGDSLRQMMLSKKFRPLPGQQGQQGMGEGGEMAQSMTEGRPTLLGGESLLDGPIADSIAGRGNNGGNGMPGAPTARIDRPDKSNVDQSSSRRTNTPESGTLLLQYDNIADAYFRRLTTKP